MSKIGSLKGCCGRSAKQWMRLFLSIVLIAGLSLGTIPRAAQPGSRGFFVMEAYAREIGAKNPEAQEASTMVLQGKAPSAKDYSSSVAGTSSLNDTREGLSYETSGGSIGYSTTKIAYETLIPGAVYRGGNARSGLQDSGVQFDSDHNDFANVLPYGDTYIDTGKLSWSVNNSGAFTIDIRDSRFVWIASPSYKDKVKDSNGLNVDTDPLNDGIGIQDINGDLAPTIAYLGPINGYLGNTAEAYRGPSQPEPAEGQKNIIEAPEGSYLYQITYPNVAILKDGTQGNLVITVTRVELETTASQELALITLQQANNLFLGARLCHVGGGYINTQTYLAKTAQEVRNSLTGTPISESWYTDKYLKTATGTIIDLEIKITDTNNNAVEGSISYAARDMDLENYQDLWGRSMTEADRYKFNEALTIVKGSLSYAVTPYYDHAHETSRSQGWIPTVPVVGAPYDSPLHISKTGSGDHADGVRFSGVGAVVMRDKNGSFDNALVGYGSNPDTGNDIRTALYKNAGNADSEYKNPSDYVIDSQLDNIRKQLHGKITNSSGAVSWENLTMAQIFEHLGFGSYGTRRGDDATYDTGFAVLLDASGSKLQWSASMYNSGAVLTTLFDNSIYTYVQQSHGIGGGVYLENYNLADGGKVKRAEGTVTMGTGASAAVTVVPEDGHRVKNIMVGGKGLSDPITYDIQAITFTDGMYTDAENKVVIEQNSDGTYDVILSDIRNPRHVHADFTADYYFYKVWKGAAGNGVPTTDITLTAALFDAAGQSSGTQKTFTLTKADADDALEPNITSVTSGDDIIWKVKYPAEGYTTKSGEVWPALGIEPEPSSHSGTHNEVRCYWFVTEAVNGWKLKNYDNTSAKAPGFVDRAESRGETKESDGGEALAWAETATKDYRMASEMIAGKSDAAYLSVFSDGGKIENEIAPPEGTPKETWGPKDTPQKTDGKNLFSVTTDTTISGDPNTITKVELLDGDGNPAASVTVPEGVYTLDASGTITFTPNTGFVGDPTPVAVRGTDGNGLTAETTYTPHIAETEKTVTRTITYEYYDKTPVLDEKGNPKTVVQTHQFSGTVDPDTGEITWSEDGVLEKVDSDPIEGYTVDRELVPDVAVTPQSSDMFEKVIYSPKGVTASPDETYGLPGQSQTGTPAFEMETFIMPDGSDNQVTPKLIDPETDEPTDTVTIPGQGTYVLNENGTITFTPEEGFAGDPDPVTVEGTDRNGRTARTTYTPHIIDLKEEGTATRRIHFTYLTKDGEEVTEDTLQELSLTRRPSKLDPKTGEVLEWGQWEKKSFPAVENPDDMVDEHVWVTHDAAGEVEITEPGDKGTEYIVYVKEPYTVVYHNGDHGASDGKGDQPSEDYDNPVTGGNGVTPDKGWKFTGRYTYIITDRKGNVIQSGETDDPTSLKVIGNIEFTPVYKKLPHATYVDPATGRTIQATTDFLDEGVEPPAPADPVRLGYTFAGWDREEDAEGNVVYKAKWTPEREVTPDEPSESSEEKSETPKTGDPAHLARWIMLMGLSLAGLLSVIYRKKRKEYH